MALNFGLLDPDAPAKIAGSVYAGQQARQEQQDRNMLRQQQAEQLEIQRQNMLGLREDRLAQAQQRKADLASATESKQWLNKVAELWDPKIPLNSQTAAQGLQYALKSGDKNAIDMMQKTVQAFRDEEQFQTEMGRLAPKAAPVAPAVSGALGSGTFGITPAPANALAPAAAPVAAPTNALTGGYTRPQIEQMLVSPNARVRETGKNLLGALPKEPAEPSDIATMTKLGYPLTQAGYQAFRDAQRPDRLLNPEELKQKLQIAAASRAPAATVNVVQEKAEAGEFGKVLVQQFSDLSKAANLAAKTLPSIESNLKILNQGLDTGFGTDAKAAGAKILGALGVQNAEKYATDTQTFQSNALQAVLQKQLEQKGPQTEADAQRIQEIGPQLGKTKKANEFILTVAQEQLRRDMEQRKFYTDWRNKTGSFNGAEDAWFSGEGGRSLFDRPALKNFAVSGGAAAQIPTKGPATVSERTVKPAVVPVKVASDADYNALPSGTTFVGPDGKTRRKP